MHQIYPAHWEQPSRQKDKLVQQTFSTRAANVSRNASRRLLLLRSDSAAIVRTELAAPARVRPGRNEHVDLLLLGRSYLEAFSIAEVFAP